MGEIEGKLVGEGNRYPGESCEPGEGQCAISLCNAETLICEEAIAEETEDEHPEPTNVQIVEDDRQLRSARHYARKYDRQVRRANKHAFRASKGGWGHSYRGQQHQLYKAAKHDAKAQYAANTYAAKTGGLGLYGRQLRSARHYARKYDRQVRRTNKHAFRASKGGWGHSYRG